MNNRILQGVLIFFIVSFCYADCTILEGIKKNDNLIPSISINSVNYNVTLTVENISDKDIIIDDPFGYTEDELKSQLGKSIVIAKGLGRIYPLGFFIYIKDNDTQAINKYSRVSINMSVMHMVNSFTVEPRIKYIQELNLKDLRNTETGIEITVDDLKNKLIKASFCVFVFSPNKDGYSGYIGQAVKETDWLLLK